MSTTFDLTTGIGGPVIRCGQVQLVLVPGWSVKEGDDDLSMALGGAPSSLHLMACRDECIREPLSESRDTVCYVETDDETVRGLIRSIASGDRFLSPLADRLAEIGEADMAAAVGLIARVEVAA